MSFFALRRHENLTLDELADPIQLQYIKHMLNLNPHSGIGPKAKDFLKRIMDPVDLTAGCLATYDKNTIRFSETLLFLELSRGSNSSFKAVYDQLYKRLNLSLRVPFGDDGLRHGIELRLGQDLKKMTTSTGVELVINL